MPEGFTTEYVFKIIVEGADAAEQAERLMARLKAALTQDVSGVGARELKKQRGEWQRIPTDVGKAEGAVDRFNRAVNRITLQFFGIRRLTFQFAILGRTIERMGEQTLARLERMTELFLEFSYSATRAGIAMDLPAEMMGYLRQAILETSSALGMFDPNEVAEGLRIWAAGTGEIIRSQEQLNRMIRKNMVGQK